MKLSVLIACASLLGGCATHLATTPDRNLTPSGEAVLGIPYALPMVQFDVTLTRSITSCPTLVDIDGKADGPMLASGTLDFAVKGEAKEHFAKGEAYSIDFTALTSAFRTTSFAPESYPNGTLKGFNVSADDKTDEVIKAGVKFGLSALSVAGGGLPGGFLATSGGANAGEGLSPAMQASNVDSFLAAIPGEKMVVCTPQAAEQLAIINEIGVPGASKRKALTEKLERANKRVTGLTGVIAVRNAQTDHIDKLIAALDEQIATEAALKIANEDRNDALAKVSTKDIRAWPREFRDREESLAADADTQANFAKLITVQQVRILDPAKLKAYYEGLAANEQATPAEVTRGLAAQEAFRKDKRLAHLFKEDGSTVPLKPLDKTKWCDPMKTADDCIAKRFDVRLYIQRAPIGVRPCGAGNPETLECRKLVAVSELDENNKPSKAKASVEASPSKGPLGRNARDSVVDKGLFIRDPDSAILTICRTAFATDVGDEGAPCAEAFRVFRSAAVSAPQFGQLRFIPFRTAAFQTNEMSLLLREDGSIQKLEVKRTDASSAKIAAAVDDAMTQYKTAYDAQQKAREDALSPTSKATAEAEEQIKLLTKQQELLKLQTPPAEDKYAAIKTEILDIQTETALLSADIARRKARDELAKLANGTP